MNDEEFAAINAEELAKTNAEELGRETSINGAGAEDKVPENYVQLAEGKQITDIQGTEEPLSDYEDEERPVMDATEAEIKAAHDKYALKACQKESAKDYLKEVMYEVKLNELYKIVDSCVFDPKNEFCPVLVEIVNEQIKEKNNNKAYLLQVWSNKGEMVYERALEHRVTNWNISTDKFIFQEEGRPDVVFLVKLEIERRSTLFELHFPDNQLSKHKESSQVFETDKEGQGSNLTQDIPKLCDYIDGYLVLAWDQHLYYANLQKFNILTQAQKEAGKSDDTAKGEVLRVETLDENDFHAITIEQNYKLITIQKIGNDMSCLVMEDRRDRKVRFMRTYLSTNADGVTDGIKLVQLGLMVNKSKIEPPDNSPMFKYRSVMKMTEEGKFYMVGVGLRMNGRLEFFSDFMMVDEYQVQGTKCIDIECDFDLFYYKLEIPDPKDGAKKLIECRSGPQSWRNRIGMHTSKVMKDTYKFDIVIHKRIAMYFSLYSGLVNFQTFMLVSHRNSISTFDMTKKTWTNHLHSFEPGEFVRLLAVKKKGKSSKKKNVQVQPEQITEKAGRPKVLQEHQKEIQTIYNKYHIVVATGNNRFVTLKINRDGKLIGSKNVDTPNNSRILHIVNDMQNNCGILFASDTNSIQKFYQHVDGNTFKQRDVEDKSNAKTTLWCYKMGEFHQLFTSDQEQCINSDSQFSLFRAGHELLESDKTEEDDGDIARFLAAQKEEKNSKKSFARVLMITSKEKRLTKIFPVLKMKNEQNKTVVKIRKGSGRELTFQKDDESTHEKLAGSFATMGVEFGDNVNNFAKVSTAGITFYNKDLTQRLRFKGTNIKSCIYVHDSLLYCLADQVVESPTIVDLAEEVPNIVPNHKLKKAGFYVYDASQLAEGKVESYRLYDSIVGVNTLIDNSRFSDRFSFLADFNNVLVIPFPHMNIMNFIGMSQKQDYLVWRQKDGFFTALDKKGNLLTWSLVSGRLLYIDKQDDQGGIGGSEAEMRGYQVYRADGEDNLYTRDYYSFTDRTVQLLVEKTEAEAVLDEDEEDDKQPNESQIGQQITEAGLLPQDLFEQEKHHERAVGGKIKMLDTQMKYQLFNFKVMELKTYSDDAVGEQEKKANHCNLLFSFSKNIIQCVPRKELMTQDWDVNSNPIQRLILSQDTKLLMEVINNFVAQVYKRVDVDENGKELETDGKQPDRGQQVKWKPLYPIRRFPTVLSKQTSFNYLFSPNFKFQLDFLYEANQFCIRRTESQEIVFKIPSDLLNLEVDNAQSFKNVQIIASRIWFDSDDHLRIINNHKVDCLFQIVDRQPSTHEIEKHGWCKDQQIVIELASVVKIDNMFTNLSSLNGSGHFIKDPCVLKCTEITERLIRRNQAYKVNLAHAKFYTHDKNKKYNLLENIFSIDYLQPWDDVLARFDTEVTFTLLNWRIIDKLVADSSFDLENTDAELQRDLCFNILPFGRTILHKLSISQTTKEIGDQVAAINQTKKLFAAVKQGSKQEINGALSHEPLEMPILEDIFGTTPLDASLGKLGSANQSIFEYDKQVEINVTSTTNTAMASVILENIRDYTFMYNGVSTVEAIINAVHDDVPGIGEYLDSRFIEKECHDFKQTSNRPFTDQASESLRIRDVDDDVREVEAGLCVINAWASEKVMQRKLFEEEGHLKPYRMKYFDIPLIVNQCQEGMDFMEALRATKNDSIFGRPSVQSIIQIHWNFWNKFEICMKLIPFAIQIVTFFIWSNFLLPTKANEGGHDDMNAILVGILLVTGFYFEIIELKLLAHNPYTYFKAIDKIVDFIGTTLLVWNAVWSIVFGDEAFSVFFWRIQAVACLFIYLRLLLVLRYFEKISYLVRMIIEVTKDMVAFSVVLFVAILAFADSFFSLDQTIDLPPGSRGMITQEEVEHSTTARILQSDDSAATVNLTWFEEFAIPYIAKVEEAYLLTNGEFPLDNVKSYQYFGWFIFFIATIFNLIIMLNLLIAIISKTFENVVGEQDETMFRERVIEITSLQRIIGPLVRKPSESVKLMFYATELKVDEIRDHSDQVEAINSKVDEISEEIETARGNLDQMLADLDTTNDGGSPTQPLSPKGADSAQNEKKELNKITDDLCVEIVELKNQIKQMNAQKAEALQYRKQ